MMVECTKAGVSWDEASDRYVCHCSNTYNRSRQVYAMVQVGMDVRFYKWEEGSTLTPLSGTLNLRDDVQGVMERAGYLKAHPFRFV